MCASIRYDNQPTRRETRGPIHLGAKLYHGEKRESVERLSGHSRLGGLRDPLCCNSYFVGVFARFEYYRMDGKSAVSSNCGLDMCRNGFAGNLARFYQISRLSRSVLVNGRLGLVDHSCFFLARRVLLASSAGICSVGCGRAQSCSRRDAHARRPPRIDIHS